jgi:tetratricopeptide (TPR) repeat protein
MLKYIILFFIYLSSVEASFEGGVEAYDRGDYKTAISEFDSLQKKHESGHIYYNLGNSYFRNSQLGESMAAFLAARRLMPSNPDVKANIDFVQKKSKIN